MPFLRTLALSAALIAATTAAGDPSDRSVEVGAFRLDFDHDGRGDRIALVDNRAGVLRLYAYRTGSPRPPLRLAEFLKRDTDVFVRQLAPGTYLSRCHDQAGARGGGCIVERITVGCDTIVYGRYRRTIALQWDGAGFTRVRLPVDAAPATPGIIFRPPPPCDQSPPMPA